MTKGRKAKAAPTLPTNPNKFTLKQHVFPTMSIKRFYGDNDRVELAEFERLRRRTTRADDAMFYAPRSWDHRAETEMKRTEDAFQEIADLIVADQTIKLDKAQNMSVSQFAALWRARADRRHLSAAFIKPNGVLAGNVLTEVQLENLEKNGYMAFRPDGTIAARHLNGAAISIGMGALLHNDLEGATWGVAVPLSGEFCVPDVPGIWLIPITPTIALAHNSPSGRITEANLAYLNHCSLLSAREYIFARSFVDCPGINLQF